MKSQVSRGTGYLQLPPKQSREGMDPGFPHGVKYQVSLLV